MNHVLQTERRSRPTTAPPSRVGTAGLIAGLVLAVAGLGYAILDQAVLHGLDRHLHALYDPVGRQAQPAPLYGYLYAVGGLGVLCWLVTLRLARAGVRWVRRWNIGVLIVAALVISPLFLQEYGRTVFPLQLTAGYAVAWLLGLVVTVALRPSRSRG